MIQTGRPLLFAALLALAAFLPSKGSLARDGLLPLQLLAINDYHGHLEAGTPGKVNGKPAGGAAFLAAKLRALRHGKKHSLTVAAGDMIGGSPAFSGLFHDEPSVESLNAMNLDVTGVGNHEFDEGVTELLRMQKGGCHPKDGCYFPDQPFKGADFQWLAANVVDGAGKTPLPPYEIRKFGGVDVAFIGMTLEGTGPLVAAEGVKGLRFLNETETANRIVRDLKARNIRAIVVLLHEGGIPATGAIDGCEGISGPIVAINAALDAEIDAVITGHTHRPYNCVMMDPAGKPRPVTSAYAFGRVVTEMNLMLDPKTDDVRRDLTETVNHPVYQEALKPDAAVTKVIEKWKPLVANAAKVPVGRISADINRGGAEPGSDRGVESAAGNLVADAQLWATSPAGAVVAFMNPGGVRADLGFKASAGEGDGVVTYGEAFTFQPFGNALYTIPMTGAQIVTLLKQQCQPAKASRPFLFLAVSTGFSYSLKKTISADGKCAGVEISDVRIRGVPLAMAARYRVTVNSFLADGGDNFTVLKEIDRNLRVDGSKDLEALTNYLDAFEQVEPPLTGRVTILK